MTRTAHTDPHVKKSGSKKMLNTLNRLVLWEREGCCGVGGRLPTADGVITRGQLRRARQDWLSRTLPTGHKARNTSGFVGKRGDRVNERAAAKEGKRERVSGAMCRSVIWCLAASERLGETLHASSPWREVIAAEANS